MGKSSGSSGGNDPSDNKHEQKLQAVSSPTHFPTPSSHHSRRLQWQLTTSTPSPSDGNTKGRERPLALCPLNNVPLLHHTIDFYNRQVGADALEQYLHQHKQQSNKTHENGNRIAWSSKLTIHLLRFTDCTNTGDALRELDRKNVIKSDPFILMQGDVVTNVDLREVMEQHAIRKKADNSAIMTVLLQEVGGWGLDDEDDDNEEDDDNNMTDSENPNAPNDHHHNNKSKMMQKNHYLPPLRSSTDDLLWQWTPHTPTVSSYGTLIHTIPPPPSHNILCGEFIPYYIDTESSRSRFSDEFDYRELRSQFVANCVPRKKLDYKVVYSDTCSNGESGSYHEASYVCERHLVYRDLSGPLLLGPNASIGEHCHLQRSVLGPNCTLMDNCHVVDSHLWGDVLVEEVCEGAIVRSGAVVDRGCVIGRGCVVGAGVHLKEFTRITLAAEVEDDDDYSGFDDSSSDDSSSSGSDDSGTDDEESSADESEKATPQVSNIPSATEEVEPISAVDTNYEVVGKDGLGRVWAPSPSDEYDSDDDEEEKQAEAVELMKSESIGYDMTLLYKKWKKLQMEEEDDGFSLDGMGSDDDDMDMDDQWADDIGDTNTDANTFSHLDEDGMQITGRQKGVDVVQELRDICLEHETSSPVENLRIELNSFKFSQNATYSDCCKGAMMAVMDKVLEGYPDSIPSPGKLVVSLKKALEYWQQLFHSICMGSEEEKAIIHALETMALGSGKAADVLGKEPAFRFVLQTLHDKEIVNEVAIFEWAEERKEEGKDGSRGALFWQQPTQDFLKWLEEESSDEDSSDGSDEEDSD
ncbi:translation initiation factor eIF-2B subunit epsilon [Skeletonema marinoi]|uniref:Translation initiation factor eIF2B subunit epsilon n=1 Tax=Skeletonema marinoi TaxID=267567 RepID=A0AAD9D4A5_9STRA|nr:translation initiation factor eIF-2B subunit epsilon [Skeletonema marinoi]